MKNFKDCAPIENTLFEDGDGTNTFRASNPTQEFLYFEKQLLFICYRVLANMLAVILLYNGYFWNSFFKKNILR